MVTRSRKFKYTFFAKGLCLLLSVIMFFSAALSALIFLQAAMLYGPEEYLKEKYSSCFLSLAFNERIRNDVYKICQIAEGSTSDIEMVISEQADEKINEAVNAYLDQKAYIIRSELEYAVNNYDESYFNYEYSADLIDIPDNEKATAYIIEDTTSTDEQTEDIPRNIQAAQKILESASGREFLNYEALVRSDAFDCDFFYEAEIAYIQNNPTFTFHVTNLKYSESQIKTEFYNQYTEQKLSYITNIKSDSIGYSYELEELKNLSYYAENSDGEIYTNLTEKPTPDTIKSHNLYAYYDGTNVYMQGIEDEYTAENIQNNIKLNSGKEVYIFLENDLKNTENEDVYSEICSAYYSYQNPSAITVIAVFLISIFAAVILLIIYACLCGHTNENDYPVLALIDKVPADIHFILSFGLVTAGAVFAVTVFYDTMFGNSNPYIYYDTMFGNSNPYIYYEFVRYGLSALAAACWAILAEWFASTARIKKTGNSFFKRTLIWKFISLICRGFRKLKNRIVKEFSYKPQKMQKLTITLIIGYIIINLLLMVLAGFCVYFVYEYFADLIFIALLLTFNILVIIFLMKYIRMFDNIISASCEHRNIDFGNEKVPEELRLLANNLTNTNAELERAVAQAVKDEQMKTELITNVSHDLKTPLTSLITYSDLLSRCDITDENAVKYTNVIHQQSIKLKRLIEDLIEASKVSTGNVTLNMSVLNLSELAVQAIVEFSPETEKNGNEIKFNEPEIDPKVIGDSAKVYRIISNLLNNARKYSAPNTRIYVSVYSDGINGYFEVKNISSEPLNISPDELTERFVRGDKSRSKEGNGLGLAIAKDLCNLQNGELKLIIDGDLFKAIVKLPCKQEVPTEDIEELQTEN